MCEHSPAYLRGTLGFNLVDWGAELVDGFRVEAVEVESVQNVENSLVVIFPRELRYFVEQWDQNWGKTKIEFGHFFFEWLVDARLERTF